MAFIDLSAAFDTVNHGLLLEKMYKLAQDFKLTQIIESLMSNRRFFVTLAGKNSRWKNSKNGLPQGSVLAPTLFNIYTNDQYVSNDEKIKHFIYVNDAAIAVQDNNFETIEDNLTYALKSTSKYYASNHHITCAFHLRNREANRKLKVTWKGEAIQHCDTPVYLEVTLDRT